MVTTVSFTDIEIFRISGFNFQLLDGTIYAICRSLVAVVVPEPHRVATLSEACIENV